MNTKTINTVQETYNYNIFKTLKGNRKLDLLNLKRLKKSISNEYLMSPIIINEKYEIIDGQHRFESAKQLGLPINYILVYGYGLSEVQTLNENTKNWKKIDYLNSFCDMGLTEYLKFRSFMNMFPNFGLASCEAILYGLKTTQGYDKDLISNKNKRGVFLAKVFENGNMVIPDIKASIEYAKKIMALKGLYDGYSRRTFILAMISIFKIEDYNHTQFIERLKVNKSMMVDCTNVSNYRLIIEDIYNHRSREKISLRY